MENKNKQKLLKKLTKEDESLDLNPKKAEIFINLELKMGLSPEEVEKMSKDMLEIAEALYEDKENIDPMGSNEIPGLSLAMGACEIISRTEEEPLSSIIGESPDNPE